MANKDIHGIKRSKIIALIVSGGIGRNIMATAVVRALKKAYPQKELHVIASCPDVFLKNPNIKRVHRLGNHQYFFSDYILERNTCILDVEPYRHRDYVYKEKHFIDCWCELLGIESDGHKPEIFLSKNEDLMAQDWIKQKDKPLILLQHQGGKNPENKSEKENLVALGAMHRRHLPIETVNKVVEYLNLKGFIVGSVQHENQRKIENTELIQFPIRAIIALVPHVPFIIGIDSFLQHACAGFGIPGIILWGGTHPKILGYDSNVNLSQTKCKTPACHRPNSYLFDIETTGFQFECNDDEACMNWEPKQIIEEIDKFLIRDYHAGIQPNSNRENCDCGEKKEADSAPCGAGKICPTNTGTTCPSSGN